MTQRSPAGSAVGTLTFQQLRVNHFLCMCYLVVGLERVCACDFLRYDDAQSVCKWAGNEETLESSLSSRSFGLLRSTRGCGALNCALVVFRGLNFRVVVPLLCFCFSFVSAFGVSCVGPQSCRSFRYREQVAVCRSARKTIGPLPGLEPASRSSHDSVGCVSWVKSRLTEPSGL
jgi:hypothetical protein